jgi:hypothetical protein
MAESSETEYPALVDAVIAAGAEQVVATVKSINSFTRKVVLEMPDGEAVETVVKPDMKNLENVNPGDKVVIDHVELLVVAVENIGTAMKGTDVIGEKTVAPESAGLPGKTYTVVREAIGMVDKVDAVAKTVTIDIGAGRMRTVQAGEAIDISNINSGDTVKAQYVEQLSISVISENTMKPKQ